MAPTRRRKPEDDVDLEEEVGPSLLSLFLSLAVLFFFKRRGRQTTWNYTADDQTANLRIGFRPCRVRSTPPLTSWIHP